MDSQQNMQMLDLRAFFSIPEKLSCSIPGYQVRKEQIELAETIQEALETKRHCLAEAGTGVGKSLAYLIPGIDWALRHQSRLLVSTHTKALQSQLMTKELPRLAEGDFFQRPFRYEICLGAENYICLLRLLRLGNQEQLPGSDPDYIQCLRQCLEWCQDPVSGLRQDFPEPISDSLWQRICIVNDLCLGRKCPYFAECYLQLARKRQREADVLVANHYLFFSNNITGGHLLPECKAVILDEAHKLEDVATQFLGETLSQFEVQHLLTEIGKRGKSHFLDSLTGVEPGIRERIREKAVILAAKQDYWWKALLNLFHSHTDTIRIPHQGIPISAPDTELINALAQSLTELQQMVETEEQAKFLACFASRLSGAARIEQQWFERVSQETVYWAEKIKTRMGPQVRVHITPLDLSGKLERLLFSTIPSVILTSATLAINRDFAYVRSRLGITDALEVVTDSPFPYSQQAALYLPDAVPDPRDNEAFVTYVLTAVRNLIDIFDGGLFVLCTSYRMLYRVADYLRDQDSRHIFLVQGEAPPQRLVDYFREDRHAVILGVETFWQGVDIPGDALRCVVITRLPFDVPTHPVHQARAEYLASQGENPFLTYSIPRAALMLRQGFGRLIRGHKDRGVVVILDPRIRTREWGNVFLEALPLCPRFLHLEQIQDFVDKHFCPKNTMS